MYQDHDIDRQELYCLLCVRTSISQEDAAFFVFTVCNTRMDPSCLIGD